ncbi:MAG: glycosyl hydrolase [Reichenbachiella sp.]
MNKSILTILIGIILSFSGLTDAYSQKRGKKSNSSVSKAVLADSLFSNIKMRNIGPAFMSGRIADIAIHPENENIWYVAVGSGGVWKTVNAGITWTPIFDNESSYSIGCVTIDSNNPNVIWVGTGENVGGRHVGFGDGIYKSIDGGNKWTNMGLKKSEHISKIIVHPTNSNVVWVAAQGPLWSSGGERGFYKTTDGGKSWKKTLGDNQWTGVTDIAVDPRNPDRLYAATWQRHRTVAILLNGGPNSGLHRSLDGGETWEALKNGIPNEKLGKIGIAISPQNPDVIYAAIEMELKKGGVFKSSDRGLTWKMQSNTISGGTGPHYYQELYASPHYEGKLYFMNNYLLVSDDGGKTFYKHNKDNKHVDNHAIAFKKNDKGYLLIGTDGGLYESFDLGTNWRFMENLPITQFYKIAVDDAAPFYNVYGGTQDNNTQGGPSRTDNVHGIRNADWKVILYADGHQPATEPGNPDIVYAEWQEGGLTRIDMKTGEAMNIQPQPGKGEFTERFNWDAPILVSPHNPTTIYFASNRVWKSENRGDKWVSVSGDLTKNQNRIELPIMGKKQSWENAWDVYAMSNYNTITSLSESPVQKGLLYVGTDDGIVQVSENDGGNWKKILVSSMPGIPSTAFVNDIKADLHDANTVYVSLDNHKYGDFKPYIMKSTDKGVTWRSLKGNLPNRLLVWRLVQDHINPKLLFLGTEYGVYFSIDGGSAWTKFKGGVPTISFRDLAIQKRENDLVGGTFGRGIYILDDYSFLRDVSAETLKKEAKLFETREADWYIPRPVLDFSGKQGSQGAEHFVADNPEFGATFTYYLKDSLVSRNNMRKNNEKSLTSQNIPFPGWDVLEKEMNEQQPNVWLVIKDTNGKIVNRVKATNRSGFNRVSWGLRYPVNKAIRLGKQPTPGYFDTAGGRLAPPGKYTATLFSQINNEIQQMDEPISFDVTSISNGALEGADPQEAAKYWASFYEASSKAGAFSLKLKNSLKKVKSMQLAAERSMADMGELDQSIEQVRQDLLVLESIIYGNRAKRVIGEKTPYPINDRLMLIMIGFTNSTYGPTDNHLASLAVVNEQLSELKPKLQESIAKMNEISIQLQKAGAPWIEGDSLWED